jgi:pyrroloquinoline quinone biosynthesis protein D
MSIDLESRPRLAPGCRMNEKTQQPRTLLMPERALRLNGPSLEIVERCDGKHTVQQIITELQQLYSKAEPAKVEQDILGYLARTAALCTASTARILSNCKRAISNSPPKTGPASSGKQPLSAFYKPISLAANR